MQQQRPSDEEDQQQPSDEEVESITAASFGFPVSVQWSDDTTTPSTGRGGAEGGKAEGWKSYYSYDASTITSAGCPTDEGGKQPPLQYGHQQRNLPPRPVVVATTTKTTTTTTAARGWETAYESSGNGDVCTLPSGAAADSACFIHRSSQLLPPKQRAPSAAAAPWAGNKNKNNSTSVQMRVFTSTTAAPLKQDNKDDDDDDDRPTWFVCAVAILLVLIFLAVVGALVCGLGHCT